MFHRGVFIILCIWVGRQECSTMDEHLRKFLDLHMNCTLVCTGSGGIADMNERDLICKCSLDGTVDENIRTKIRKEAQKYGIEIVLRDGFTEPLIREAQSEEHFVGQRAPNKIVTPRPRPSMYHPSTTRQAIPRWTTPRAITPDRRRTPPRRNTDIQKRLEQIQKRINDRRRSRARNSAGPRLQLRAGFEDNPQSNLMDRLKEMQKEIHEKRKQLKTPTPSTTESNVAAPAPKPDVSTHMPPPIRASHNAGGATNPKVKTKEGNHHVEIITQDPSLYKDGNKL